MISILGLPHSNFIRSVALVCAQKQQPYQVSWQLGDEEIPFRSEAHYQLHGFAKIPVIRDEQVTLGETLAICRYLDAKYPEPALQPESLIDQAQHDAWCSMAITQIDQALIRKFMVELAFPSGPDGKPDKEKLMRNKPGALKAVAVIEKQLQATGTDYICSNQFTLADALIAPMAHYAAIMQKDLQLVEENSPIHGYLNRIMQQPGAKDILV